MVHRSWSKIYRRLIQWPPRLQGPVLRPNCPEFVLPHKRSQIMDAYLTRHHSTHGPDTVRTCARCSLLLGQARPVEMRMASVAESRANECASSIRRCPVLPISTIPAIPRAQTLVLP